MLAAARTMRGLARARAVIAAAASARAASARAVPDHLRYPEARGWNAPTRGAVPPLASRARPAGASMLPVDAPWPGLARAHSEPSTNVAAPSRERVTHLANGVTVASVDHGSVSACVTLFVNAGARHETAAVRGVTHALERMAFSSSAARSQSETVALVEALGSNTTAIANYDSIMYSADGFRKDTAALAELVCDNVAAPLFDAAELDAARELMRHDVDESYRNFETVAGDVALEVAFGGENLGSTQLATDEQVAALTRARLVAFASEFFVGRRVVLAAVNVDHAELVAAAERQLGALPAGTVSPPPPARYVGGLVTRVIPQLGAQPHLGDWAHVALAFRGASWNPTSMDSVVEQAVLQSLLGGGSSFSAGGPGKGMYTRLYRNVLHHHAWVNSTSAINVTALDSGLFGLIGSAEKNGTGHLLSVLASELAALAWYDIDAEELSRARNMLCGAIAYNLERRFTLAEDIGRQYQLVGQRVLPEDLYARIQGVSAAALTRTARALIDGSVPTVVACASTADAFQGMPELANVRTFFDSVRAQRDVRGATKQRSRV